ncbi:hypothetical protein ACWPKO_28315 (plasmid) [Coraliomargarita sp. W4R53]
MLAHASVFLPAAEAHAQLAIVVRELELITGPLCSAIAQARTLDGATDWQSKTAATFHLLAQDWASDLGRLGVLAYEATGDARRARDYAAVAARGCP